MLLCVHVLFGHVKMRTAEITIKNRELL